LHLEEFAEGNSLFHKLDPRLKLIIFIPIVFSIAFFSNIKQVSLGLLISLVMTLYSRLDFRKLAARLIAVNIPILLLWFFLPFSYHGEVILEIGRFSMTDKGINQTLLITIKANAIVLATISLIGTSEIFSLAHALIHLRVPSKIVHLFFFFYRYISVIHEEYERLKRAMIVRSFKPRTNAHTYRSIANLVGMLLVKSYERSQRIYNAMLCRGFKGSFFMLSHFEIRRQDILFCIIMVFILFILYLIK
jgi:cobalt/nickel transport system permease protein